MEGVTLAWLAGSNRMLEGRFDLQALGKGGTTKTNTTWGGHCDIEGARQGLYDKDKHNLGWELG